MGKLHANTAGSADTAGAANTADTAGTADNEGTADTADWIALCDGTRHFYQDQDWDQKNNGTGTKDRGPALVWDRDIDPDLDQVWDQDIDPDPDQVWDQDQERDKN